MTDTPQPSGSPTIAAPADNPEAGLVAFVDCELIGISNAMTLVINRQNGNQQVMSPEVVEGLMTCTEFKTLEAHAAHLASTRPELNGQQVMAESVLGNLKEMGMLLEAGEICARLARPAPRQLPATRAFIITCDRPAAVGRLLESMLQSTRLASHDALFLVDDSREEGNREANREAVAKFNKSSTKEMFYVGEQAQAGLLSGLAAALPEHASGIHFLLDPAQWRGKKTYGRSRTLCLLLSVGYRALLMDDDILCHAVTPPVTEPGIGIGSSGLRKAAFYANEEALRHSGLPAGFDPLSGHATLLGSNLGHALQTLNEGPLQALQLQNINAALANVLAADSPVLVTQCGTLGDPGTHSRHWVLYQSEDTIVRWLSAPHGMTEAVDNRLNWLGSSRPNVIKMPVMSQLTGLDNSQLLPPYFPAFRGEDALFGAMLVAMHPHSVTLEYPWSVPHLPLEERSPRQQSPIAASGGISLFVRYLTERIDYRSTTSPQHNLDHLAREALRMSARSDTDLLMDYRRELAGGHADQIRLLQAQLARTQHLRSDEWQDYLKRGIAEVQQALVTAQSPTTISGVPAGASESELLADFRHMAQGFGAALAGWAGMREASSGLVEEMISSKTLLPH